jgi:hypothetical protein
MEKIRSILTQYPIKTRLSLSGPLIVARDIAHAKLKERLDKGEGLPQYVKDHLIYYAGPAKTPEGYASGKIKIKPRLVWTNNSRKNGFIYRIIPKERRKFSDISKRKQKQGCKKCL